ncbi:MAG: ATP synthase F1 subunit delta [Tissierellia bacterium]|nr:ATP synthase F1 subunit delta [Tissierellia bacterium]
MAGEFVQKYAEALFDVIKSEGVDFEGPVGLLKESFQDQDLRLFMAHPKIDTEKKKELLGQIFGQRLPKTFQNFLFVLVDNRRILNIQEILKELENLFYEDAGIRRLTLVTAYPLDEGQVNKITKAYTSDRTRVEQVVDPSLIGGVIIREGNRLLDYSLKGKLEKMEQKLHSVG